MAKCGGRDYLASVDLKKDQSYRHILDDKLNLTPFNCGRSVVMPPFEGEGTTSVYSLGKGGKRVFYVTNVSASENLWQKTDACHLPARAKQVTVSRFDAEIPQHAAELIKEMSLRMLQGLGARRVGTDLEIFVHRHL